MSYTLKFDGGCYPNPGGPATYGAILYDKYMHQIDFVMGIVKDVQNTSNNMAEHYAAYHGMKMFLRHWPSVSKDNELLIQGDSEIAIRQLLGRYRLHKGTLYYDAAVLSTGVLQEIKNKGVSVKIEWIPRELNQDCDDLTKFMSKGA